VQRPDSREDLVLLDRKLVAELDRAVGGALSTDVEERICYSFDATDLRSLPAAVVWPRSTEEVAGVVRIAGRAGVPVVARGAGTGYTGGSVPVDGGIVVSFEKMDRVLSIDVPRRIAVVEPGIINETLRDEVEALGLFYPPDPASLKVSTIGGNVAEGAGGPRTVLYGTTRDYVVGLEFVLADGSIVRSGVLGGSAQGSWDPAQLLVGSEGTLAIVTAVALRLSDRPELTQTYWSEFRSLEEAAEAVSALTASGLPVSVLEIVDRDTLAAALAYVRGEEPPDPPEAALLIEVEGKREATSGAGERLRDLLTSRGALGFREATTEEEREDIWEVRRSISPSLARLSTGKINEDIAVPRSAIPAFVREMHRIADSVDLRILAFGHAGDGNLHVNILLDRSDRAAMIRARRAVGRLFAAALELGGTLTGEHGIGITKADHLADELDEWTLDVAVRVKRAFDPQGLMNPDKILTDRPNPWWRDLPPEESDGPGRGGAQESSEC